MRGRVANVIICFKFYRNRLSGFQAVRGWNGGLSLTLTVALTTGQHCRAACDCRTVVCGVGLRAVIYYYHGTQINFCSWWRSVIGRGPGIVTDLITPRFKPGNRSPYRSVKGKIIWEGLRDESLWNRLTDRILIARPRLHSIQRGKNGRPNFGDRTPKTRGPKLPILGGFRRYCH